MEDREIVALYWEREEAALDETAAKYTPYCQTVARHILQNREDAEECVNDAFEKAWNAIPPHRPENLKAFLGKLTRNLALNRYQHSHAAKRGGGELALALSELESCLAARDSVETACDAHRLTEALDRFLAGLSSAHRMVFVRRYWYLDPVRAIAERYHMSESRVKSILFRVRKELKAYLQKEGLYEEP